MIKKYLDYVFKDLEGRRGKYVIAEIPNAPLIIFMISMILGVGLYPGKVQMAFLILGLLSFSYWGWLELRSGRSRFRKFLGGCGLAAVLTACIMWVF